MGGGISVRSKYGKGSVFTVELPQKIGKQADFADETTSAAFTAPTAKALVVDDVQTNLVVAQGLLSFYGMEVRACLSGAEAIEAVKAEDYDVVFMDHMMPEMDGIEAAMRIRNLGRRYTKLPIVALTANAVSGMKQMFKRNGFNDYLSKPIDTAKLNAVLERWIPKEKQVTLSEEAAAARFATAVGGQAVTEIVIDGVDAAKGLSAVRGSAENYLRVLSVFCKDGQNKIAEIDSALSAGDMRLYATYVHALKSASANIGAARLSETALSLETAGKEGNRAYVDEYTPRLIYDLKLLLFNVGNFLKAEAARRRGGADGAVDAEALKRTLSKLKEAVAAVAIGDIRAAMKELQPYASSNNPVAPQIDSILQCALGGRYDEAVGLIDAVLGILG